MLGPSLSRVATPWVKSSNQCQSARGAAPDSTNFSDQQSGIVEGWSVGAPACVGQEVEAGYIGVRSVANDRESPVRRSPATIGEWPQSGRAHAESDNGGIRWLHEADWREVEECPKSGRITAGLFSQNQRREWLSRAFPLSAIFPGPRVAARRFLFPATISTHSQ